MSALSALLVFLISFMIVAVFFKMPVSFALGTSSLLVLAYGGLSLTPVPQFAFSGLDSFALLAIPFYIFAGEMCIRDSPGTPRRRSFRLPANKV